MTYRASMNTVVSLYPHYGSQKLDWNIRPVYVRDCENGRLAYAEFKYYILHYFLC